MRKKNIGIVILVLVMLMILSTVMAYGDTSISTSAAINENANVEILQSDIDQGIYISSLYPVSLSLDEQQITFSTKDVPPMVIKERTLIPARALFEAMGGTVTWNNDEQKVYIAYDDTQVVLTIGSGEAVVNGAVKQLDVPALIIDHDGDYYGSTMIPVRFSAEALGCKVEWKDPERIVAVTSPSKISEGVSGDEIGNGDENNGNIDSSNENNGSNGNENQGNNIGDGTWIYEQLNDAARGKIVAIDMGHGGKDSGTIGHENMPDQVYEKDLNLPIGLKLNEYLKSAGVSTYMIRETDIYYTLLERAGMANSSGATMFVSIHNNSNESSTPNGTEVLFYSKLNENGQSEMDLYGIESKNIAENVQKEMVSMLGTYDRGKRSSPAMAVLNKTSMPAIIVEGAFLSNEKDFAMMTQPDYVDKYALAVAKGIIKSLNEAFK